MRNAQWSVKPFFLAPSDPLPEARARNSNVFLPNPDGGELAVADQLVDAGLVEIQEGRNLGGLEELEILRRGLGLARATGRRVQRSRQERGLEADHPKQEVPRRLGREIPDSGWVRRELVEGGEGREAHASTPPRGAFGTRGTRQRVVWELLPRARIRISS